MTSTVAAIPSDSVVMLKAHPSRSWPVSARTMNAIASPTNQRAALSPRDGATPTSVGDRSWPPNGTLLRDSAVATSVVIRMAPTAVSVVTRLARTALFDLRAPSRAHACPTLENLQVT